MCSLRQEIPAAPSATSPPLAGPQFGPVVKLHLPAGRGTSVLPKHELTSLIAILPPCAKPFLGAGGAAGRANSKISADMAGHGADTGRIPWDSSFCVHQRGKVLRIQLLGRMRSLFHAACLLA